MTTTTINSAYDLKKRTAAESGIMKSIILTAARNAAPERDDILLHDYQMATSTTLNSIFLNYLSCLDDAERRLEMEGQNLVSYFQLVRGDDAELYDNTKMVLKVDEGDGTFLSRSLKWKIAEAGDESYRRMQKFVALDTIWYGIRLDEDSYSQIVLADKMNDYIRNSGLFNAKNPFDAETVDYPGMTTRDEEDGMEVLDDGEEVPYMTINRLLKRDRSIVHEIVENKVMYEGSSTKERRTWQEKMAASRYILCLSNGLYGVEVRRPVNGRPMQTVYHDIGAVLPNIKYIKDRADCQFLSCEFCSIGDAGRTIFLVVLKYRTGYDEWEQPIWKYGYIYLDEDAMDSTYGFTPMNDIVIDQTVFDVDKAFDSVTGVKGLDTVNIVATNNSFWDIEENTTNFKTVAFSGGAKVIEEFEKFNCLCSTKVVSADMEVGEKDKASDYGVVLRYDETDDTYKVLGEDGKPITTYPSTIEGHPLAGGNQNFAVYDAIYDKGEPVEVMLHMTQSQFNIGVFSNVDILNDFMKFLFSQVTNSLQEHLDGIGVGGLLAEIISEKGDVGPFQVGYIDQRSLSDSLTSAWKLLQEDAKGLSGYCTTLYSMVNSKNDTSKLSSLLNYDTLAEGLRSDFLTNEYDSATRDFLDNVLGAAQTLHPVLRAFREYLEDRLRSAIEESKDQTEIKFQDRSALNVILQYIADRVQACLVIGGYDETKTEKYPNLNAYLHRATATLEREDVEDVFSAANIVHDVGQSIKGLKFFYDVSAVDGSDLFTFSKDDPNLKFLKTSSLVKDSPNGSAYVDVYWRGVKTWLAGQQDVSEVNFLRTLVRTQVYRPLYFNAEDHETFTSDPAKYKCTTIKSFVDFLGDEVWLKRKADGDWEIDDEKCEDSSKYVEFDYDAEDNTVKYEAHHSPIDVLDGRFTFQDIQYFTMNDDDGLIYRVYYNRFQRDYGIPIVDEVEISDSKFKIGNVKFQIQDSGELKIEGIELGNDEELNEIDGHELFSERIDSNGMFEMEGVWYVLEKNSNGEYVRAKFSKMEDNALLYFNVAGDSGKIEDWGLTFNFTYGSDGTTQARIVQEMNTDVVDRVTKEWCAYDDKNDISIDENKTFEWWLSRLVNGDEARNGDGDLDQESALYLENIGRLGKGNIYDGILEIPLNSENKAKLSFWNDIVDGYVITKGTLTIPDSLNGDATTYRTQEIGAVFGSDLDVVDGDGNYRGTLDGRVQRRMKRSGRVIEGGGNLAVVRKKIDGSKNDCNAMWMDDSAWTKVVQRDLVGWVFEMSEQGQDAGVLECFFDDEDTVHPSFVRLLPVQSVNGVVDGEAASASGYVVEFDADGADRCQVNVVGGKYVHFVSPEGMRYMVDISEVEKYPDSGNPSMENKTKKVYVFKFNEQAVGTFDFTTQFSKPRLIESLTTNIKDWMLNGIVQGISSSTDSDEEVKFENTNLDLYLNLFSDNVSAGNYIIAQNVSQEDTETGNEWKFRQVYKNSLQDIDYSLVDGSQAEMRGCMNCLVDAVFPNGSVDYVLIDRMSTFGKREWSSKKPQDVFYYDVLADVTINVKKEAFPNVDRNGWIVGNVTVKDVQFVAEFRPAIEHGEKMRYTVTYIMQAGNYKAQFDEVIYKNEGRVRRKSIDATDIEEAIKVDRVEYTIGERQLDDATTPIQQEFIKNSLSKVVTSEVARNIVVRANKKAMKPIDAFTQTYVNRKVGDADSNLVQSIWPLDGKGDQAIDDLFSGQAEECRLLNVNRGRTTIEGETYQLENNGSGYVLNKLDGGGRTFNVVQKSMNAAADSSSEKAYAAWVVYDAAPLVLQSVLESKFNLVQIGDDRCLQYKNQSAKPSDFLSWSGFQIKQMPIVTADVTNFDIYIENNTPSGESPATTKDRFFPNGTASVWAVDYDNASPSEQTLVVGPNMWEFPSTSTYEDENVYFNVSGIASAGGTYSVYMVDLATEEGQKFLGVPGYLNIQVGPFTFTSTSISASVTIASSINHQVLTAIPALDPITGEHLGDRLVATLTTYGSYSIVLPSNYLVDLNDRGDDDGADDQQYQGAADEGPNYQLTFAIKTTYTTKMIFAPPVPTLHSGRYIDYNFLVDGDNKTIEEVLPITDWYGSPAAQLDYGCVMNYRTSTEQNPDQTTDVIIPMKKKEDGNWVLDGDGHEMMFIATVLLPWQVQTQPGQICGRKYEVEVKGSVYPLEMDTKVNASNFIFGSTYAASSFHYAIPSDRMGWKRLVVDDSREYTPISTQMRQSIIDMVNGRVRVDDGHFNSIMQKLGQFLNLVNSELNGEFGKDQLASILQMEYHARFKVDPTTMLLFSDKDMNYGSYKKDAERQLIDEFMRDFALLSAPDASEEIQTRAYAPLLKTSYGFNRIMTERTTLLEELYLDQPRGIRKTVFSDSLDAVQQLGLVRTDINLPIDDVFVSDGVCSILCRLPNHVAAERPWEGNPVQWRTFNASENDVMKMVDERNQYGFLDYRIDTENKVLNHKIAQHGWRFRYANATRPFSSSSSSDYIIRVFDDTRTDGESAFDTDLTTEWRQSLWWLSALDVYLKFPLIEDSSSTTTYVPNVQDVAYERNLDALFVKFLDKGDRIYRYDSISRLKDSQGWVSISPDQADMVIETSHSTSFLDDLDIRQLMVVYQNSAKWEMKIYATNQPETISDEWQELPQPKSDVETWRGITANTDRYTSYNNVMFGDTLFDSQQMRFQNMMRTHDVHDIVDIWEVDDCYYGLVRGQNDEDYAVFRTSTDGIIQRLPYQIGSPSLFKTADSIYSLFAVEKRITGVGVDGSNDYQVRLQEITTPPDPEVYIGRTIPLDEILKKGDVKIPDEGLVVKDVLMSNFQVNRPSTSFYVLSNAGFHKIGYEVDTSQMSIDRIIDLKQNLKEVMTSTVLARHLDRFHHQVGDVSLSIFDLIEQKINQFNGTFSMFDLIPAEFRATQDVGVVPTGIIDTLDEETDHRPDSVLMNTDILWSSGIVADADTNPGIVSCGVSSPATTYDDEGLFPKSQRNPSIEGTEFYDYICDSDGNVLMDLYKIPFIYQVNSNNTYDLYINVPTTRTKYINRIAGSLKSDGTSQVMKDDTKTRLNFNGESLPNNLDESTTRLKVFIDRKYVSVGNIELVEICGNTIPTLIYRDAAANDGLYDSIALESRWNGEVEEIVQPEKDINKVALEFECYGTDGQSIHIRGKTMTHHIFNDDKYEFEEGHVG